MQDLTKTCFVIMPFTVKDIDQKRYADPNHWNEVYEGLILPAVQGAGLRSERDDRDIGSRLIAEGILEKLETADLVLCDLSSHNANVFLELGWTLRADRPFILIKDNLTDYTFDLNQQYTFTYTHSLQPTTLRSEIVHLTSAIRRTLDDKERRYSLTKRMSISLSAIKAVEGGDVQVELLSDIRRRLVTLQDNATGQRLEVDSFPWPILLTRATAILSKVKEELKKLETVESSADFTTKLISLLTSLGAYHSREIQVGIIDETQRWLFHDWPELIGIYAEIPGFGQQDIKQYPHGAAAWIDVDSNIKRTVAGPTYRRMNIGLFSTVKSNRKVLVEVHHELE